MKILLAEHDRGLLFAISRFLKSNKHEVEEVFDGVIAINNFSDDFDLLVIDSSVPRVPYKEIIKLIKEKKPSIKIVVLINDFVIDEDELVDNRYVDDYIPRPFMPQDILVVINDLKLDTPDKPYFTKREYLILDKLRNEEVVSFYDIQNIVYRNEVITLTYISAINKKLEKEEIILDEKGFKLVKKDD